MTKNGNTFGQKMSFEPERIQLTKPLQIEQRAVQFDVPEIDTVNNLFDKECIRGLKIDHKNPDHLRCRIVEALDPLTEVQNLIHIIGHLPDLQTEIRDLYEKLVNSKNVLRIRAAEYLMTFNLPTNSWNKNDYVQLLKAYANNGLAISGLRVIQTMGQRLGKQVMEDLTQSIDITEIYMASIPHKKLFPKLFRLPPEESTTTADESSFNHIRENVEFPSLVPWQTHNPGSVYILDNSLVLTIQQRLKSSQQKVQHVKNFLQKKIRIVTQADLKPQ